MAGNSAVKRKRNHTDDEKLNHTASVQFTREIKKIRTFEIQKVVKILAKDSKNPTLIKQVELIKELDINQLVRRALLYLGLDPPEKKSKIESSDEVKALELTLLKHKRLIPLMETWKIKANKRAEKLFQEENAVLKQSREEKQSTSGSRRSATTTESMFVGSLSGLGEHSGFDDDIADFLGENRKKNRPGQRARKQKALMEEQRRTGKTSTATASSFREISKYGPSDRTQEGPSGKIRPPRPTTTQGNKRPQRPASTQDRQRSSNAFTPSNDRQPQRQQRPQRPQRPQRHTIEDKSHPSWAAKQAQKDKEKDSIHAFSGKKVVFDD